VVTDFCRIACDMAPVGYLDDQRGHELPPDDISSLDNPASLDEIRAAAIHA
jgi:hypothetical protein